MSSWPNTSTVQSTYASGCGMSQTPIFVTTPKFDCEKMPSRYGPNPYLNCCQVRAPGNAPMPVRTSSPSPVTTSRPH